MSARTKKSRLLCRLFLLHLHLLFCNNRINRALSSMTNQKRRAVFCVTDFAREGVKNIHSRRRALRENLQAVYCQELPQRFVKEEENQRETLKKRICRFRGVKFTSGGERPSFEKPFRRRADQRRKIRMGSVEYRT